MYSDDYNVSEKIEFLENDFKHLLKKLTEKYHPEKIDGLANIACILLAARNLCHDKEHHAHTPIKEHHRDWGKSFNEMEITHKMKEADEYYRLYQETHDLNYKQFAKDCLKQAKFYIRQEQAASKVVGDQQKMKEYNERYNHLLAKLW